MPIRSSSKALKMGTSCESREGSGCHRLPPDSTGNARQVLEGFINFFFPKLYLSSSLHFFYPLFVKKSTEEEADIV